VRLNYEWKFKATAPCSRASWDDTVLMPTAMNPGTRAVRIKKHQRAARGGRVVDVAPAKADFTDLVIHQATPTESTAAFLLAWISNRRANMERRPLRKASVLLENSGCSCLGRRRPGRAAAGGPGEHAEVAPLWRWRKDLESSVVVGTLYVRNARRRPVTSAAGKKLKTTCRPGCNPPDSRPFFGGGSSGTASCFSSVSILP